MLSAVIHSEHSYPAMPLARQLAHQRFVHPGPLVLGKDPLKYPTPTKDRDRTVSRRSKPSSRTALIGEQPNPWDLLQPQDAVSRHRKSRISREWTIPSPKYHGKGWYWVPAYWPCAFAGPRLHCLLKRLCAGQVSTGSSARCFKALKLKRGSNP